MLSQLYIVNAQGEAIENEEADEKFKESWLRDYLTSRHSQIQDGVTSLSKMADSDVEEWYYDLLKCIAVSIYVFRNPQPH